MYKNLKIQERLKKCFTVVALLASIAGVIGAIMMLIISTQYKQALTNYGFSQGDMLDAQSLAVHLGERNLPLVVVTAIIETDTQGYLVLLVNTHNA